MSDISTIRNLGPAMQEALIAAGVPDAETLREIGADAAYAKLLQNGHPPHFIGFYVLHMGLQGRPWNDCKGAEKAKLRKVFDTLKAQHFNAGRSELDKFMDDIGLIDRR